MNKQNITLLLVLQLFLIVGCKKPVSSTYETEKISETITRYTHNYDDDGNLLITEIEEKETSFPITNEITNTLEDTDEKYSEKKYFYEGGKLVRIETYTKYGENKILSEVYSTGKNFEETIKFTTDGDTLYYDKIVTNDKGQWIEDMFKSFIEEESGLKLEEYSITYNKNDDMSGKTIKQVSINLLNGDTVFHHSIHKLLRDTMLEIILENNIQSYATKTYHDKKENIVYKLEFDKDDVLISQTTSWLDKMNEVFLETSSRKSEDGTYFTDSTFYQNEKIIKRVAENLPLIFRYFYKYDEKGNLIEEVNEVLYLRQ